MDKENFIKELSKIGINLTDKMLFDLEKYYELLIFYNKEFNLTAITNKEDVYLKHFYDSLTLSKAIDLTKNISVCDVGSGAGFPGIVLKIIYPNLSVTLVDSLDKRIKFLNEVIEQLGLKDIKAIHSRIEELKEKEAFDLVVSRAVAKTNILLELSSQLCFVNGYVIFMKGYYNEELKESKNAYEKLNYNLEKIINFKLPMENSERNLVVFKKNSSVNSIYPREFSKIKKKPL